MEFKLIPVPVATADILNLKFVIVFIPLHLAAGAALGRDCCFKLGSLSLCDVTIRLRGKRDDCQKGGGSKKPTHRSVLQMIALLYRWDALTAVRSMVDTLSGDLAREDQSNVDKRSTLRRL